MISQNLKAALTWNSVPIFCLPPKPVHPEQMNAEKCLWEGTDLEESIHQSLVKYFFQTSKNNGHSFCLPICLMTPFSNAWMQSILINFGKKLLKAQTSDPWTSYTAHEFDKNFHHSLMVLNFEKTSEPLQAIRDLQANCAIQNAYHPRIILLLECHLLSDNAQDALLKFLEEPFPGIQIFLTINHFANVSLTLLSRCLKAHTVLVQQEWKEVAAKSKDLSSASEEIDVCWRLCQNDPLTFFQGLHGIPAQEKERIVEQILHSYSTKNLVPLLKFFSKSKQSPLFLLGWIQILLVEWLKRHFKMAHCFLEGFDRHWPTLAQIHPETLQKCWKNTTETINVLRHLPTLNVELALMKMVTTQMNILLLTPMRPKLS